MALLDDPSKGKIIFNNKDVVNFKKSKKMKLEAKIFHLYFRTITYYQILHVLENVMMPLVIRGETLIKSKNKAQTIFKRCKNTK